MAKKKAENKSVSTANKRSIARRFNDALSVRRGKTRSYDLRTARRLRRYRKELAVGRTPKKRLSPIEVALRVSTLLQFGDKLGDIKKLAHWKPVEEYDEQSMVALLTEMHSSYGFSPEAYRFVGIRYDTLLAAGVIEAIPTQRGRKKGSKNRPK